jgi:hypothetical protein
MKKIPNKFLVSLREKGLYYSAAKEDLERVFEPIKWKEKRDSGVCIYHK